MKFTRVLFVCLALLTAQSAVGSRTWADELPAQPQARVQTGEGDAAFSLIDVRPLEDPANPYLGLYSDVDRWIMAHPNSERLQKQLWPDLGNMLPAQLPQQPGDMSLCVAVDPAGWLIPFTQQRQTSLRRLDTHTVREALLPVPWDEQQVPPLLPASGSASPEIVQQIWHERWAARAQQVPPIPAWLAEHPPLLTRFLPRGLFLCVGEMGTHLSDPRFSQPDWAFAYDADNFELSYIYDSQGKLLHSGGAFNQYDSLREVLSGRSYTPHIINTSDFRELPPGQFTLQGSIFKAVVEGEAGRRGHLEARRIMSAEDVFGDAIDLDAPAGIYGMEFGPGLTGGELATVYQLQLEQGLTSADSRSPYAGTAEGPQVAASFEPRVPHKLASPSGGLNIINQHERRVVLPLDAPGNPYSARYSEWDSWLWEHYNNWDTASARSFDRNGVELKNPPPPGTWVEMNAYVDSQGYMLPVLESQRLSELYWHASTAAERDAAREQCKGYFKIRGGARLSDEELHRLNAALWPRLADLYPKVPDWLIAMPVGYALILPDGQVVTRGYAGCWQPFIEAKDLAVMPPSLKGLQYSRTVPQQAVEKVQCRYSAGGELLASQPSDPYATSAPWQVMFNMSLLQVAETARGLGQYVGSSGPYLTVQDPAAGGGEIWYGLDGTPWEPASAPVMAGCQWLEYPEYYAVYMLQQEFGTSS